MAKKKKSSWKKKLGKVALAGLAGYAAYKGLGKRRKSVSEVGQDAENINIGGKWGPGVGGRQHIPKPYLGPVDPGAMLAKGGRTGKKHGGRTGKQFGGGLNRPIARPVGGVGAPVGPLAYKHGGKVKSMGVAKRGGGVAKR